MAPLHRDQLPFQLTGLTRWVTWQIEDRDGKPTKVPKVASRMNKNASHSNSETWCSFDEAIAACPEPSEAGGVGFVLGDGIACIDLDNCIDGGLFKEWAIPIIQRFATYTEVSPSGRGAHIWFLGAMPEGTGRKRAYEGCTIEAYSERRFITISGRHVSGTPTSMEDRGAELLAFVEEMWPTEAPRPRPPASTLVLDDRGVIEQCQRAANAVKFTRLYDLGDLSDNHNDDSAADLALCNLLAFYTQDAQQMDRIFRSSALLRDKWDEPRPKHGTYGLDTIHKAIDDRRAEYNPNYRSPSKTKSAQDSAATGQPQTPPPTPSPSFSFDQGITAAELQRKQFAPLSWPVADFLCEGLTLAAGREKMGKSRLFEELAIAVSTGRVMFGSELFPTERGRVLLLALEEDERLIQERFSEWLGEDQWPENLHIFTDWPTMDEAANTCRMLDAWMDLHPDTSVVIVDTFKRVRKRSKGNTPMYEQDYDSSTPFHDFTKTHPGVAVVLLTHANKTNAEDDHDTISGSTGLPAVPDRIMVLRRKRGEPTAVLSMSGRRGAWRKIHLKDDDLTQSWFYDGEAEQAPQNTSRQQVLDALREHGAMNSRRIAYALNKTTERELSAVRRLLIRMRTAGDISCCDNEYTISANRR